MVVWNRFVVAAVLVGAVTASAQEAAVDGGVPAAVMAPAVKPEPPKEPPQLVRVYGLIKPLIVFSSGAVESYSQPNATATTAAGNPVYSVLPANARLTFQVGQSRFGLQIGEGLPYRGHIEFDFVDFTKSSPTVASLPRVRIAKLSWQATESFSIHAGQDWDIVQPVNPHGINYVGGLFQAGNTAFMRQQVKAFLNLGMLEVAGAIGLTNNNNGNKDATVELGIVPTFAVRAQLNLSKSEKVGISGIFSSLTYKGGTPDVVSALSYLIGAYADISPGGVNLRAEAYYATNAANLFLLSLGQGRGGVGANVISMSELGGFVSARIPAGPLGIYALLGGATVLDPTQADAAGNRNNVVIPSYSGSGATAALAGTGPGMKWNVSGRLGIDVKIWKGLAFQLEGFWVRSYHVLSDADNVRLEPTKAFGTPGIAQAFGCETGFVYTF